MVRISPDPYSFLIENVAKLPVIANQDQEFWLAAAISCIEIVVNAEDGDRAAKCPKITVEILLTVYDRCTGVFEELTRIQSPESNLPSWNQLLAEALEARERIFHFRISKLFRAIKGPYREEAVKQSATKAAVEIAQCLLVLPLGFLLFWRTYFDSHGKHPSAEAAVQYLLVVDSVALLAAIETGAIKARQILIEGYLRYSLRMALAHVNMGVEYADLVQEAALGLVLAAEKYRYLDNGRFALFATVRMWAHLTRCLADDSRLIRLPVGAAQKRQDILKQMTEHFKEISDTESLSSFIKSQGHDVEKSMKLLAAGVLPVRLDSPAPQMTRRELDDLLVTAADAEIWIDTNDVKVFVTAVLAELSERERDVISSRSGINKDEHEQTLDEIGLRYGKTRERIRQVEAKALKKLKRSATRMQLDRYHGPIRHVPRVLDEINCEEVLSPAHPYMPEDRQVLDHRLNVLFGRRQSIVRQGLTIKGRLIEAFDLHGMPLHTRELNETLRTLHPLEEHLETTLYSVMAGSPETFVSLGGGVFGLAPDEDAVISECKGSRKNKLDI